MGGTNLISLSNVLQKAAEFAVDNWEKNELFIGNITSIVANPGLKNGCPALRKYCKGYWSLGLTNLDNNTLFAWHGTDPGNVASICHQGFNPALRRAQMKGRGEYFGQTAENSYRFANYSYRLIVVQIIMCGRFCEPSRESYLVDNPIDWSHTFCLPLLVVTYDRSKDSLPPIEWLRARSWYIPAPFSEYRANAFQNIYVVYRWYWVGDPDLTPYFSSVNDNIEHYFQRYINGCSSRYYATSLKRCSDNRWQRYIIDFELMTQTNKKTGFVRRIVRQLKSGLSGNPLHRMLLTGDSDDEENENEDDEDGDDDDDDWSDDDDDSTDYDDGNYDAYSDSDDS